MRTPPHSISETKIVAIAASLPDAWRMRGFDSPQIARMVETRAKTMPATKIAIPIKAIVASIHVGQKAFAANTTAPTTAKPTINKGVLFVTGFIIPTKESSL